MKYYGHLERMDDWKEFLPDPDNQWVDKCSAKELARAWANCRRFPRKVHEMLEAASLDLVPLFGFPEYKVNLPGGRHPSRNDLYILARDGKGTFFPIMVVGRGDEPSGPLVHDWKGDRGEDGLERLAFIADGLDLAGKGMDRLRYNLLQEAVSVLLEGSRVGVDRGMLLVHSFGNHVDYFEDYGRFLSMFDLKAERDIVQGPVNLDGFSLYFGWVQEVVSGNS